MVVAQSMQGNQSKEPNLSEFVSAMAAGNNSQLMVEACHGAAGATTLALVAAAQQTGGRVVCILPTSRELRRSEEAIGGYSKFVEFVVGDASTVLLSDYSRADFVLIDCDLEDHEGVLRSAEVGRGGNGVVVVGHNAFHSGSWQTSECKTRMLPIGDGVQVARVGIDGGKRTIASRSGSLIGRRSKWVVKIDENTGEEHVFRVTSPKLGGQIA